MRKTTLLAMLASTLLALPGAAEAADDRAALIPGRGELRVIAGGGLHTSPLADDAHFSSVAPLDADRWVAAGVRGGSKLLLVRGEGEAAERIAVPEVGGAVAAAPVPLTSGGELLGLAWLAGDDPRSLSVRYARWEGGGAIGSWSEPERVAAPGPGSQLALSGSVLRDGSTMLVWSRFDGTDDEIFWSRHDGRRWSPPARLAHDNRVPDVTPVVAPLGDGAVVAWSRFGQGTYHLTTARWSAAAGWSAAERIGPRGSVHPRLLAGEDGALLLYRDARRRGYEVLRLDEAGRITGRAFLAHESPEGEPALLGADGETVRIVPPRQTEAKSLRWQPAT